jgi:hypothetical protein
MATTDPEHCPHCQTPVSSILSFGTFIGRYDNNDWDDLHEGHEYAVCEECEVPLRRPTAADRWEPVPARQPPDQ